MSEVNFHYSYSIDKLKQEKFISLNPDLITKKCFLSFLKSINYFIDNFSHSKHTIGLFFAENQSKDILDDIDSISSLHGNPNISFERFNVSNHIDAVHHGIQKQGFHWLQSVGKQFVFNVQDNHLFEQTSLYEMFLLSNQFKFGTGYDILTSPFNKFKTWLAVHGNLNNIKLASTEKNKWFQYIDLTDSFMTTHKNFSEHWDIYNKYFNNETPFVVDNFNSLNVMLHTKRNFGFVPVNSLAYHIVPEIELSSDKSWITLWDSMDVTLPAT